MRLVSSLFIPSVHLLLRQSTMSINGLAEVGWPGSAFTTRTRSDLALAASATTGQVSSTRDEHDVTYKVLYPKLHGMAATTRILLALGGVRWESVFPTVSS